MPASRITRRALSLGPLLAVAVLAACAQPAPPPPPPPQPTAVGQTTTVTATVESVDRTTREVLLSTPNALLTVKAGPEVRNLDQLKSGDRVVVEYAEAVAVALSQPGDPRAPAAAMVAARRAPPGARPGAGVAEAVRVRVAIQSVNAAGTQVTFVGPSGTPRTVTVRDPAMQDFARRLRPGDQVEVAFVEAVVVRVEPMAR
jgi:hypothetical protein